MLKISCLHTAQSNIAVFEAARRELGLDDVIVKHRIRSDLLLAAEQAGRADTEHLKRTADELYDLARTADGVLLTCSTLGAAVALAAPRLAVPVLRIDQALAHQATLDGGRVIVLCAASTTLAPTRALFEAAAMPTSATVEIRLVPGAWDLFRAGRETDYHRLVADAVDAAAAEGAIVALTQASMAGATAYTASAVLTSPTAGLSAIVAAAAQSRDTS